MKRLGVLVSILAVLYTLSSGRSFAQHGGGHGGGVGGGSSHMDRGNDRATQTGKTESTRPGSKTPGEMLSQNSKLSTKLASLLAPGTDLQKASQGFKNLGQFVAAAHVSHNLGIPFDQLKAEMMGPPTQSLGKAIHELKPAVKSKEEAKKATKEADDDLRETEAAS